jgi:hypothetical protein
MDSGFVKRNLAILLTRLEKVEIFYRISDGLPWKFSIERVGVRVSRFWKKWRTCSASDKHKPVPVLRNAKIG